ncbi:polyamine aminopropyltransferase [Roseivirga pacifica]|uniref:polyamine aminopropyltransferase n=1 Tax=Roseivirga pacifica TaxID=1267423 RepID=UPI002094742A|nr:polyamine aminopropyltransferase [Roseivirga pacifica]MCO6360394.1 polyamine aminopropyltransferase [Roseivirga pacifica]MCO6368283.1 polyamine aminopropyltransferase [Roseivirga pacifica]MCO6372425.1 polyamine aminopropyltransferase [Roseivirga pacifica]MCO6376483.1 polyamine aminopropyltransferase [Roseivirga pacifica]MCO6378237.1 polyamine aminopropyltransferase [Roseivirga pacifica]|tara:strand:+ start:36 stop:1313 length:1278 start_codon:yes stop_codon:yes gene_type:complete
MASLGRHIIVEYYDCSPEILNDVVNIEKSMINAAEEAGATIINSTFHHFSPYGVSGVVVIQESHLAIHTWPEYGYASVDLFTCGDTVNPWVSYQLLKEAFKAGHGSAVELSRGEMALLKRKNFDVKALRDEKSTDEGDPIRTRDVWFTERDDKIALSLKHDGKLYDVQSDYQRVSVFNTQAYGNMLTLDGMVMTTEKDEYVYHEMITHIPMLTHPNPKRALVIGGGDGGTARELLRHDSLEEVVMVEIDDKVIEASKMHLPTIASALEHPKLNLIVDDGIKYVNDAADESFDLVIVDSTDPVGPAEGLFTVDFYKEVYRILSKDGIMVTQSESPRFNSKVFKEIFQTYRGIYGQEQVHCYLAYIPTYPTGMWSFSYSSKGGAHPIANFDEAKSKAFAKEHRLKYYNEDLHKAAFALPSFVRDMIS